MNEPWVNPKILAVILGGIMGGIGGPLIGALTGIFAPKGKAKKLVLGVEFFMIATSLILFVIGVIAYLQEQPRFVWYGFGYTGLLCTVIFSIGLVVTLKRYREADLRKSMSAA